MARELKYSSPNTDLAALQRELAGQPSTFPAHRGAKDDGEDDDDEYADRWASDDEDDDWAPHR